MRTCMQPAGGRVALPSAGVAAVCAACTAMLLPAMLCKDTSMQMHTPLLSLGEARMHAGGTCSEIIYMHR